MLWPWISRAMHAEVLRAKDETITLLRESIAKLEARLETPIQVKVELPPDFAVLSPAVVSDGKERPKRERKPRANDSIDLASIDPNDPVQMAALARQYMGRDAYNSFELKQVVRGLRQQIRAAKAQKERAAREAVAQEADAATSRLPIEEPEPTRPEVAYVPLHIANMIETAAQGGVQ